MISGIEHIGIRLRQSRMQKGLSQAKLGQLSSTNQGVIQKIENGASLHPTKIMEIAEVLDVNPAWLQFGEPWDRKNVRDRIPDPLIILTEKAKAMLALVNMFKRREIYRHLSNGADRVAIVANRLHDIVVKIFLRSVKN